MLKKICVCFLLCFSAALANDKITEDDKTSDVPDSQDAITWLSLSPENYSICLALDVNSGRLAKYVKSNGGKPLAFSHKLISDFIRSSNIDAVSLDYYSPSVRERADRDERHIRAPQTPGRCATRMKIRYQAKPAADNPNALKAENNNAAPAPWWRLAENSNAEPSPWLWLPEKGSLWGGACYVWELKIWEELGKKLKQFNTPFILYAPKRSFVEIFDRQSGEPAPPTMGMYVVIDQKLYDKFEGMRKDWLKKREEYPCRDIEYKGNFFPLEVAEVDGDLNLNENKDYYVFSDEILFDKESGRIITTLIYTANEPRSIKLHKSDKFYSAQFFASYVLGSDKEDDSLNCRKCGKYFIAEDFSLPEPSVSLDKTTGEEMPEKNAGGVRHNVFTMHRGWSYGGECFIWDLFFWKHLGDELRKSPEAHYIIQDYCILDIQCKCQDTLDGHRMIPEIYPQSKYIRVDRELYAEMEKLRQNKETAEKTFMEKIGAGMADFQERVRMIEPSNVK